MSEGINAKTCAAVSIPDQNRETSWGRLMGTIHVKEDCGSVFEVPHNGGIVNFHRDPEGQEVKISTINGAVSTESLLSETGNVNQATIYDEMLDSLTVYDFENNSLMISTESCSYIGDIVDDPELTCNPQRKGG